MADLNNEVQNEPSVEGLRDLKKVFRLFKPLKDLGTERDTAGNRTLFADQYVSLVLLSLFNPSMQTVSGLSDASALKRIQKAIGGGGRVSVGAFSEAARVFDPAALEPILQTLLKQMPAGTKGPGPVRNPADGIPAELLEKLRSVDGSVLRALPQIVNAVGADSKNGQWRLHLQFRVLSGLPGSIEITTNQTGGDADERNVLCRNLEAGCIYTGDIGYERYSAYQEIVDAKSDYVIRGQDRPVEIIESLPLTDDDRAARVVSDEIVRLAPSSRTSPVDHRVRRVIIERRSQGRQRTDRANSDRLILFTNLTEVPASVIAAIYAMRWCIELFFRWLKHLLGCRKLLSCKTNGVTIQVYVALIAALLLARVTGTSIGKRGFNLISMSLQGWADEDEVLEGLARIAKSTSKKTEA